MASTTRFSDAGAVGDGATALLLQPAGLDPDDLKMQMPGGDQTNVEGGDIWSALRRVLWPVYVPSALFGMADGVSIAHVRERVGLHLRVHPVPPRPHQG